VRSLFDLPTRANAECHFYAAVLVACVALKAILLIVDDRVRLFMGDSATYLWSAASLHVPADRSYTYPLFLRALASTFSSIDALLWAQALCGVATATMMAWLQRDIFKVRRSIAFAAAMAVSLDPLQLFYERMVMTESLSTCVLVASLCAAVAYVRSGRLGWLVACIALGLVSASLRVGLVPLALGLGVVAVLSRGKREFIARHLLLAITLTCAVHGAYRQLYGWATHEGPTYIRDGGLFRLGLVAPLVRAEDFDGTRVDAQLLDEVTIPLADEQTREAQIWMQGGLIDVLKRHAGTRAYKVASKIASHAVHRDPLGVIRLGVATTADYFNPALRQARLYSDLGYGQPPDAQTIGWLRDLFDYDASGIARTPSPVYRYFESTPWWPTACLFALAPLSIGVAFGFARRNRAARLLALVCCGLVVGQTMCSHIVSFRYLHPFTVLATLHGAIVIDGMLAWITRSRTRRGVPMPAPVEAMAT
jgi:hypothetical protein